MYDRDGRANGVRAGLPLAIPGQVVGLFGGSFDPAHGGHVHLSYEAIKRLGLDQLWWMISPANPLKAHQPAALAQRMAQAKGIMRHPKVKITALETQMRTRYSYETIARLQMLYPRVRFIWLMGADNLRHFHHWRQWRQVVQSIPIAVFARGQDAALHSPSAQAMRRFFVDKPARLARTDAPAWSFAVMPMRKDASSLIRRAGLWGVAKK